MGVDNSNRNLCRFCKSQHIDTDNITGVLIEYIKMVLFEKTRPEFPIADIVMPIRRAVPVHAIQLHVRKSIDDFIIIRELPTQIGNIRFYAAFVQAKSDHKNFHYFISVIAF